MSLSWLESVKSVLKSQYLWVGLMLIMGVGLRTVQFTQNSSMWYDELTVARNIQSGDVSSLVTEPLKYNVVAPVGFLVGVKGSTTLFGDHNWAYRLLPWLLSIAGLIIFWLISRRYLYGVKLFCALALFVTSIPLILYSGQAKQYSGDVAVAVFLVGSSLYLLRNKPRAGMPWLIGIGGALGILLSMPAVPLSFLLGLILLVAYFRNKTHSSLADLLVVGISWATGATGSFLYARLVVDTDTQSNMKIWWADGFPSTDSLLSYLAWFPQTLNNVMGHFIFFDPGLLPPQAAFLSFIPIIILLLSVLGIYHLMQARVLESLVLLAPLLTGLGLAVAGVYPFRHRVALYAIWPLIIFGFLGLKMIRYRFSRVNLSYLTNGIALVLAIPLILIALTLGSPPYVNQPSEPVLSTLKNRMQSDDILYVYCKSTHALEFYGPKVGIDDWEQGRCYDEASSFKKEIVNLRDHDRVWFFYTQWTAAQPFPDSIRVYFEEIGTEIDHIPDPYGGRRIREATAYLYEISE